MMKIVLHQRYWNKKMKRVEVMDDVRGDLVVTDHQSVHLKQFKDEYELFDEIKHKKGML